MAKVVWKPGTMLYPVPAVMVTARLGEVENIFTVSWAGTICTNPPMVSISVRPERYSYELIKQSGEFVINVPGKDLAFAADFCGVRSGRDVNKFDFLMLEREAASAVNVPIIKLAPLALECRVKDLLQLGSHHMFIAEVVAVDVNEDLLDASGKLHLEDADLIAYNHGHYCVMSEIVGSFGFSVKRREPAGVAAKGSKRSSERPQDPTRGIAKSQRPDAPETQEQGAGRSQRSDYSSRAQEQGAGKSQRSEYSSRAQAPRSQAIKKPGTFPAKKGYKKHKTSKNS